MNRLLAALIAVVAVERLVELAVSRRNVDRLVEQGGRVVEGDGYRAIVAVHAAWFVGLVLEGAYAPWAGAWPGTAPLLVALALGEALRLWAIGTLGRRWTTRVVVVPGESRVEAGPYRWLRHPNYAGVVAVLVALPLAFGLWGTAAVVGAAKLAALRRRVRREEDAWRSATSDAA